MSETTYAEKLKHPKWQKKRLEIMQRDNFKCVYCGDTETTLNVHHLKYAGKPWEANDDALITVCEDCHREIERRKRRGYTDKILKIEKTEFIVVNNKTRLEGLTMMLCDCKGVYISEYLGEHEWYTEIWGPQLDAFLGLAQLHLKNKQ